MGNERFSLMTMNLAKELIRGSMTVEDALRLVAEEGIPYVDVMRVSPKELGTYQKAITATGVKVCCYICYVSLFSGEKAIRSALEKDLCTAKSLGAQRVMIVPYYPVIDHRKAKKLGREQTLEALVRGFQIAVAMGREFGLDVCFETTPQEDIRLSGTDDCLYVLERVPGLSLVLDTANMLPHGDEPLTAYEALKKYIVHVHLKDVTLHKARPSPFPDERSADGRRMQLVAIGEGVIPVREIYHRMLADGYEGAFAIEYARPRSGMCKKAEHRTQLEKHLAALQIAH